MSEAIAACTRVSSGYQCREKRNHDADEDRAEEDDAELCDSPRDRGDRERLIEERDQRAVQHDGHGIVEHTLSEAIRVQIEVDVERLEDGQHRDRIGGRDQGTEHQAFGHRDVLRLGEEPRANEPQSHAHDRRADHGADQGERQNTHNVLEEHDLRHVHCKRVPWLQSIIVVIHDDHDESDDMSQPSIG